MDVVVLHKNRDYVLLPKEDFESMKRTIGVLKDKDIMRQLVESRGAKGRPFREVMKELDL